MKSFLLFFICTLSATNFNAAQNVGIGNPVPTEKLHVDSGSIKIGKLVWNLANPVHYLKFGDGNFVTLGEEEADDKLTIRARELFIRPSTSYNSVPLTIQGTNNFSHFYFGTNEDTYIRGGKSSSNVVIGDGGGRTGINVYPQRAMLEQNGAVGTTAAIFGGEGQGISIQRSWPAIGFNSWYDGVNHRSIGTGYAGQLGVNPGNGTLHYATWNINAPVSNGQLSFPNNLIQKFHITRFGNVGIGTDDPQVALHIKGDGSNDRIRLENTSSSTSTWEIFSTNVNIVGGFGVGPALCFFRPGTSVIQACIDYDGTYYYDSDKNVKKNIEYLKGSNYIDKIMQLKPSLYNMKEDSEGVRKSFGFISQDVETVFPEVVKNAGNVKLMGYTKLIPILTKGIQDQQRQLEILQKENAELKARMDRLEKINTNK